MLVIILVLGEISFCFFCAVKSHITTVNGSHFHLDDQIDVGRRVGDGEDGRTG